MFEKTASHPQRPVDVTDVNSTITVDIGHIHRLIALTIFALTLAALWALLAVYRLGLSGSAIGDTSVRLFDLDGEQGLPAAFSFLLLLATGGTVFVTTWAAQTNAAIARHSRRWRLLALALVFVAFDEAFVIHEWISGYLRTTFDLSGYLYHAWVIPYGAGALVLGALLVRPVLALPRRTAVLLVGGAACYVLGAAGLEVIGAQIVSSDASSFVHELEVFAEELMEWAGVWLFLTGMFSLLADTSVRVTIR